MTTINSLAANNTITKARKIPALMATTAMAAASLMALGAPAKADNWADHEAVVGGITIDTGTPNTTNIFQQDNFVKVRGDGDITADWAVNLMQPGSSSQYVLYDIEGDPTFIEGKLNANGQVVIFDKQGTIFSQGSVVKVGSILTTTGHISDADLKEGKLNIVDAGNGGAIVINGSITVADAGLAAFVAPTVVNNGVINAKMGKVALASGDKVTLDLYGDNLVEIAVDDAVADGLIENNGVINAEGGTVYMAAQTAKNAVDTVINTKGIVRVSSVEVQGGKIILSGGKKGIVKVSGELNANGTSGGDIKVMGQNVEVANTALLSADAYESGKGGTVFVYGTDYAIFSGRVSARGGLLGGDGGDAEISGGESVGFDGSVDLGAFNGLNGTLLIDPRHLNLSSASFSVDWAYILSGGLNGTVNINDQALANTLRYSNVNLWASETLNTKSAIDISTWKGLFGSKGIAMNDLTLAAPTVNLLHDIILGQGELNIKDLADGTSVLGFGIINVPAGGIQADVINLDGGIYARSTVGGATYLAGDNQLNSDANTVNVKSDKAFIQQGIWLANDVGGGVVNVSDGTYAENLVIEKSLTLTGSGNAVLQGSGLGGTAILAKADAITVDNMKIRNYAQGILSTKGSGISLLNNNIRNIKGDGIRVTKNGGVVTISGNKITNVGDEGIEVHGSEKYGNQAVYINNNIVKNSGDDGIQVDYASTSLEIKGNRVTGSGSDGIEVHHSNNVNIGRNTLKGSHDQGIDLEDSNNVRVARNRIYGVIENEGIYASNIDGLKIVRNRISDTEDDGIYVEDSYDVTIRGNRVRDIQGDGIHVEDVDTVLISNNRITNVDDDGIDVNGADEARILGNTITTTGDDGIVVSDVGNSFVYYPLLSLREGDEGDTEGDPYHALIISGNTITDAGQQNAESDDDEGEEEGPSPEFAERVSRSKYKDLGGDGIDVSNSTSTLIESNTVTNSYDDGIVVEGNESGEGDYEGNDKRKEFNIYDFFGSDTNVVIRDNDVTDSGSDGIEVLNITSAVVDINRVLNSGANGFYASGPNNGDVVLTGNTFTDNNVGARFESGLIDLTGAANTFVGGVNGMEFDPFLTFGYIGMEEIFFPYGEGEGGFNMYFPMFGDIAADLNLVDDTIGTSVFSGQSQYYVELLNGALFNPGTPTILNGLNATFGSINPSSQGGALTQAQFDEIESRIFHYVDAQTLGLFFYGFIDDTAGQTIGDKDTYRVIGGYAPGNGPLSLTITGLPNIPGFSGSVANFLNSMSPAAGGDSKKKGTSAAELASIEPAAGGDGSTAPQTQIPPAPPQNNDAPESTTTCWGDAMAAASGGSVVNMSFGNSPDSSLSNAASCQTGI